MRILVYSDSAIFSGAEAVLRDVTAGLAGQPGLEVLCAAPAANRELTAALREASGRTPLEVPQQPLRLAGLHLLDPRRRRRAARLLRDAGPDLLLVNLPSAEYGALPLTAANSNAAGILHVSGSPKRLGFRLGSLRERLARRALRRLDAVCVLTPSAARDYEELWQGGRTLVRVVRLPRPGLAAAADRDDARRRLGLPRGEIVGMAGRVSINQKGHDVFVEAASLLARDRDTVSFAVAGEGRDLDDLRALVRERNLDERFRLLGRVTPISVFLSAIDAIALPSRFEGLPLVALEALTAGVPGVASATDGLRDVWPEEWRVPAGDPAALAERLAAVLDSPEDLRRRLIEQGRDAARACTSDDVAADVGRILREVAERD